jgi:predicted GIY-YIG superfamily endonuclease
MFNDTIPAAFLRQRVYLLHFVEPYKHARHYLGCSEDVGARNAAHHNGTGARLMQVVREAGISWVVAKTWRGGRTLEHRLKGWHSGVRLCPICRGEITIEEVLAAQPPPPSRVIGKRMPMTGRPVQFYR